jgi:DNA-binding NtrC family response regulator
VAWSVERGAQGVHSAHLLRRNKRAPANVIVQGGSESERVAAVRTLHSTSRLAGAPFCAAHGARDHDRLLRSLLSWLGQEDGPSPLDCEGGTLYVDDPGALSALAQRMLIDHCERSRDLGPVPPASNYASSRRGPARIAAGSARDLRHDVSSGRLLPALHDTLDKLHLRLGISRRARAH